MEKLSNTFRILIKIAGKILFVIGLVLNIGMLFFGFWPSLIYILIMLFGAGLIAANKKIHIPQPNKTVRSVLNNTTDALKKIDTKALQGSLKIAVITVSAFIVATACLLFFGQNFLKKRNTINTCKEMVLALDFYKESKKTYPTDLKTLITNNPMRIGWDKDDWGNPYQYKTDNNGTTFILVSSGKDGKFNTRDDIEFRN
ncbi:MAG: type II secretion system protein GspG [Chitinophagaceae bacterium]